MFAHPVIKTVVIKNSDKIRINYCSLRLADLNSIKRIAVVNITRMINKIDNGTKYIGSNIINMKNIKASARSMMPGL